MTSITTRKRRSRKGVKWINHHYSKWYRIKLAFSRMGMAGIYAQGLHRIKIIQLTKAITSTQKMNKSFAIAAAVINTHANALKLNQKITGINNESKL